MENRIFREETVDAFKECVLRAAEMDGFALQNHLNDAGLVNTKVDLSDPSMARFAMDGILDSVNWTDPVKVKLILPIFEDAYAESPRDAHTVHAKIDISLAGDGFQIKDGRVMQLAI